MRVSGFALWVDRDCSCAVRGKGASSQYPSFAGSIFGNLALIWLAYSTLATRSLHKESSLSPVPCGTGDLALARTRLSLIVSRETSQLDEDAILRALVETVSENISDAIVAPLFYLALFGPVGALVYKAINTMDSMLGYKNERYRYFGSFAARADDVANWVPARISGWLLVGASALHGHGLASLGKHHDEGRAKDEKPQRRISGSRSGRGARGPARRDRISILGSLSKNPCWASRLTT